MNSRVRAPGAAWLAPVLMGGIVAAAAGPQSTSQQPLPRNPSVIRIGVDLVHVDATVTDERGRHVPDLTAADFEVLQDGKRQTISSFAYVSTGAATLSTPDAAPPAAGPRPTPPITRDRVGRTIALIVDDLGLSFESVARVRNALRRFIDQNLQPTDLVAILRTGAGIGALQQFTTDRRALHAAAERVQWNMRARVAPFEVAAGGDARDDALQKEMFTAGTLGAVRYVLRGVAELPGRKSIILFSDGFSVVDGDGRYGHVLGLVRSVGEAATRAGVVVYTIDARGLAAIGPSSTDVHQGQAESRRGELRETQNGLAVLADDTGGLFIRDSNNLAAGVRRALDDQQGYYLLGYVPHESTFSAVNPKFHTLRVNVKRPGLRVRSRRGFRGEPDRAAPTTPNRMVAAITSPFAGGDIRLRLSSFFGQVESIGPVVQSYMHVDARDLTFIEQPDRTWAAQLETLAVTFGENGQVADQHNRRYTVSLSPERHARALKTGFVYNLRVPVKRAGPYQLRIALRDVTGDRIGSASHFVDVPDVKKGRLTLSGLLIQGVETGTQGAGAADAVDEGDPDATLALRRFRQGSQANYVCYIYNARRGPARQPHVETEVRLFRDGVEVFRGTPRTVAATETSNQLIAGGMLRFGPAIPPGSYVLEISVTDRLAKKWARATQSIDFEVID